MVGRPVGCSRALLPQIADLPECLIVSRSDVTTYCLNPFTFHINHDPKTMQALDSKVQEFGGKFDVHDHVDEPPKDDWTLVKLDDRWHRTQVLEKYYTSDDECFGAEVCLIDSGRREKVDITQIFKMPAEVLIAAPAQSLRIFPKNIQRATAASICELFEYRPEANFCLTFETLSMSGQLKPHLVGIVAEVEVGYKEWIPLRQLFLSPFVEDGVSRNGTVATTSHGHTLPEDIASTDPVTRNDTIARQNGIPSTTPRQNDVRGSPQEDDEGSDSASSEEESSAGSPDQDDTSRVTFAPPATNDPVDLEGENQGIVMTKKTLANAKRTERRNEVKMKYCQEFRKGHCSKGAMCPHPHIHPEDAVQTVTGRTNEFREYPDHALEYKFTGFGLCTHVDEQGLIYLVLPYGDSDIWTVLELKMNLNLELREITQQLSRRYDLQQGKNRSSIAPSENLAVVRVDRPGSGALRNVPQGWYRAKILKREAKSCTVLLVDHGATIDTGLENLYALENDLVSFKPQALRCRIPDTVLGARPERIPEIYEDLKEKILIFKVYDYHGDTDVHFIQLIQPLESGSIHYGERFGEKYSRGETLRQERSP